MNIYEKMAAITGELQTVAKNLEVETGRNKKYRAVSERDILDAVKPLEKKHGVYSYPCMREILESSTLESEVEYNGKITKRTTFFSRIKTVYRFVNIAEPSEFIETTTFSEGIDSQDKGSGKAMTYGDKYALMKAYKISTGDDPDQEASQDVRYTKANISDAKHFCTDCGKEIVSVRKRDGTTWYVPDMVKYSELRFDRKLCSDCMKIAQKNEV